MKIDLSEIIVEHKKGNIFIFLKGIAFIYKVIGINSETLVSESEVYMNITYKVTPEERKEIEQQLIPIASGILNVIEMAGE